MKILSVVGARPQFIKAAPVTRAILAAGHEEILVHTGQHYDAGMSDVFFTELEIPPPAINLAVGSGSHAQQTARMLEALGEAVEERQPDWVLVYGDTNSTLAGALAAAKLQVPVAHVEAGLRSFNRAMPEEINRVMVDHISTLLFCPSEVAVGHLRSEGVTEGVHIVGDVMLDAVKTFLPRAKETSKALELHKLERKGYYLATVHRAANADNLDRLNTVFECFEAVRKPVVFPIHPRTMARIRDNHLKLPSNVKPIDPLGYLDMLQLMENSSAVLTDSGGIQKEALWVRVPCVTLRDETEWVETLDCGWNRLTGVSVEKVTEALTNPWPTGEAPLLYGEGQAAAQMVACIEQQIEKCPA